MSGHRGRDVLAVALPVLAVSNCAVVLLRRFNRFLSLAVDADLQARARDRVR